MAIPIYSTRFTPQDIQYIKDKSIGLRHLSDPQSAAEEIKTGVRSGCAFNLTFQRGESGEIAFSNLPDACSPEELERYNRAIRHNIESSIILDLSPGIELGVTKIQDVFDKIQNSCFLVIDYTNRGRPSDTHSIVYAGLGRFPKMILPQDKIKGQLPRLDPTPLKLEHSKVLETREETQELLTKITEQFHSNLLSFLRENHDRFDDRPESKLPPEQS